MLLLGVLTGRLHFDSIRSALLHSFRSRSLLGLSSLLFLIALSIENKLGAGARDIRTQVPGIFGG